MKSNRVIHLLIILASVFLFFNQLHAKSITLNIVQPTTFQNKRDTTVTHLKVTGIINKKTIHTLINIYPKLKELNLQDARIVNYIDENNVMYPANEIPKGAFNRRKNLRSVILPLGVVKIGKGAFWNCANLEEVILFDSVKVIDQFAFQLCGKLKQITFPESLELIGGACFASCSSLITIKCTSKIPPLMPEWSPFPDIKPNTCIIYVPEKSLNDYQNSRFLSVFQILAQK